MCSLVAGVIMYLLFLGVYITLHHLESYIVFHNLLIGLPSDDDNKTILINHWIPSGIGIKNVWSSLINHYL